MERIATCLTHQWWMGCRHRCMGIYTFLELQRFIVGLGVGDWGLGVHIRFCGHGRWRFRFYSESLGKAPSNQGLLPRHSVPRLGSACPHSGIAPGPAAIGHPWPSAANPASMPGCPLRNTCVRPLGKGASRSGSKAKATATATATARSTASRAGSLPHWMGGVAGFWLASLPEQVPLPQTPNIPVGARLAREGGVSADINVECAGLFASKPAPTLVGPGTSGKNGSADRPPSQRCGDPTSQLPQKISAHPKSAPIHCAFHHSTGRALARLQLLILRHRRLERPSGGSAQWATRHGCRVSRARPGMADRGGPTEQDRSEGMPSPGEAPNDRGRSALVTFALFESDSL